ncbi:MAG: hypothetical protein XE08_0462 [Parcubacteria bacterium 32_520]|nr:MAG: hypothetical protein XE08_0462 [Parcubacteria bacterium 32_520]
MLKYYKAPVAQWIEQGLPKPRVGSSTLLGRSIIIGSFLTDK